MTACPTPSKARYATQNAAIIAAARAGLSLNTTLRPYECPCTWFHLTSKPAEIIPNPADADRVAIERLVSIPDSDFREIVLADTRSQGDPTNRAALRHPRNLARWRKTLGDLMRDIEQQLHDRRDDKTTTGIEWRQRGLDYRNTLAVRATECRRRRSEAHVERMARNDSHRQDAEAAAAAGATARELRGHAREIAVDRLIGAHRDEFERYLTEEYQNLGLTVPDRFAKWTRTPTPAA